LLVPGRDSLPIGFDINGQPTAWGPPERLLLLPILRFSSLPSIFPPACFSTGVKKNAALLTSCGAPPW
jgi:hypothetical protein